MWFSEKDSKKWISDPDKRLAYATQNNIHVGFNKMKLEIPDNHELKEILILL